MNIVTIRYCKVYFVDHFATPFRIGLCEAPCKDMSPSELAQAGFENFPIGGQISHLFAILEVLT